MTPAYIETETNPPMERMIIMAKFDKGTTLDTNDLENVAGGTYIDSLNVCNFLNQAGFKDVLKEGGSVNFSGMRSALEGMGITSNDHGGIALFGGKSNTYVMNGQTLDQAGLMNVLREKFPNVQYNEIQEPKL